MTMRRTSCRAAAAAAVLSMATLVGCDGRTPPAVAVPSAGSGSGTAGSSGQTADNTASNVAKPLADWPDDLAGVLLISGEMVGYTEPCGCTSGQSGGLIRRMTFLDLLRTERKWPLALIDLGSLVNDPHGPHGGLEQTKIKFDTALKALAMLKYSAIALSVEDLKLGASETLMRFLNTLPDGAEAPKVVAANVVPTPGLDFEKRIRPSVRTTVGTRRLGVTAALDPAAFAKLKDDVKSDLMTVQAPEDVLPSVLADLETDTDLQVLMVQGPPEMARRLGLANPGFDVVVATSEFVEPKTRPETLNGGKTWLVTVGRKGQFLAAIGLPKDPKAERLYHRITLNDRYDPYKRRAEAMRKLIDEDFVEELKSAGILSQYPKRAYAFGDNPPTKATYVGAETCKNCHANTFNKWQSTKHAHAYEALTQNPKRNREADADCVRCHTTGFEFEGGFTTADTTPFLKGNQCENCHGPGSEHAASPDDKAILKTIARSADDFQKNHRCIACHDEDNAPHGFDFPSMWGQVMHKGLDDYKDPKVHEGVKVAK